MSATGETEGLSDHEYFRAVEEVFVELRGAPLLLSPKDWRTAREWHREGIPLDLVLRTLEEVFERRRESGDEDKISSLRYCDRAVRSAWKGLRELTGAAAEPARGSAPTDSSAPDVSSRLEALARALPEDLPGRGEAARRIRSLIHGKRPADPDASRPIRDERSIEQALTRLDEEILDRLSHSLSAEERADLGKEAEASLEPLAARLPQEEIERARRRLRTQKLRRKFGFPTLSLFAPEANRD